MPAAVVPVTLPGFCFRLSASGVTTLPPTGRSFHMAERPSVFLLLQQGLQARNEGRLAAAQASCVEVLQREPEQPQALHLMGQLACDEGELGRAEEFLRRSLRAKPEQAQVWFRLGHVVEDQGRLVDAELCYLRASEMALPITAP